MLSIKNIVVHYGGVQALKGISLEAEEGSITTLIGANGAGKSTTLRAISGMVPLTTGEIWFRDQRIDGFDPEEIVEMGIGHVPEGKKLFLEMSVRDNLLTGAYLRNDKKALERDIERVCSYFPVLEQAYYRPAAQMSGGEQQMLAIARGMMSAPRMLLLDEPSLGLSPLLTREVGAIIRRIADEGMTILLIEQNASLALRLSKRCYVLETGKVVLEGDSAELQSNPHIKAAYLGVDPAVEVAPVVTEAADGFAGAGRAPKPESHLRVYDHDNADEKKARRNRIPPELPPRLRNGWEPRGGLTTKRDGWKKDDPEPSGRQDSDPRPFESKPRSAKDEPVVIKRTFKPKQRG